jgi:hypothetical protein
VICGIMTCILVYFAECQPRIEERATSISLLIVIPHSMKECKDVLVQFCFRSMESGDSDLDRIALLYEHERICR